MKQLLVIQSYLYSNNDFYEHQKKCRSKKEFLKMLPEFCLNENGLIDYSEYQFQFFGDFEGDTEKKYIIFNIVYASSLLNAEISNVGMSDLLKEFSINIKKELKSMNHNNYNDKYIPVENILVFDIDYDPDGECELSLIGKLNDYCL